MMSIVLFYSKPGCATNARQKKQLQQSGCMVVERNLLEHGLKEQELLEYLEPLQVNEWFNLNAPMIKNGEIDIYAITKGAAIKLLMREPLLIRRPLMLIQNQKVCGYDTALIGKLLGTTLKENVNESCSSETSFCENPTQKEEV